MVIQYSTNHKIILDRMLLDNPLIRAGKMFGYPAYYVGRKLCICLYEQGVGVKIPQDMAEHLLVSDPHIVPFQPMGKSKMKEWIQINLDDSEAYWQYQSIFEIGIQYVLSIQP